MNKVGCLLFILLHCCSLTSCKARNEVKADIENNIDNEIANEELRDSIPDGASILISAYPQQNLYYKNGYIFFAVGDSLLYDDGIEKSFDEKLDNSDIEDMFSLPYDTAVTGPTYLADAGRSRNERLFKKMYGNSAAEVEKNLVKVAWFGQSIMFTKVNNANAQLEKVAKEIAEYPELLKYMSPASSFYWRKVRGANRQSAHSYGIAIDINTKYSDYWLWANPTAKETDTIQYHNRMPLKIVEIFEKHGFVWGGRWYHFDTMHFEYRPEIIKAFERK